MAIKTNHSENLAVRGIPNDSFLPLDRNIAINVDLFVYDNGAGTQEEVKLYAIASVISVCLLILPWCHVFLRLLQIKYTLIRQLL